MSSGSKESPLTPSLCESGLFSLIVGQLPQTKWELHWKASGVPQVIEGIRLLATLQFHICNSTTSVTFTSSSLKKLEKNSDWLLSGSITVNVTNQSTPIMEIQILGSTFSIGHCSQGRNYQPENDIEDICSNNMRRNVILVLCLRM